jgi:type IX secretion system PorP/SprF family membrane protein
MLGFSIFAKAQVSNTYNLYYQNLYLQNPAAIGLDSKTHLMLDYQDLMANMGMKFRSMNFALFGALNNSNAIGIQYNNHIQNAIQNNNIMASYSYKLKFNEEENWLRIGLSLGANWQNLYIDDIIVKNYNDPVLQNSNYKKASFDGNFGLYYNFKNFDVGVSALHFIELYNQYVLYSGYNYKTKVEGLSLKPSVKFTYLPGNNYQIDGNLKVKYKIIWASGTYRSNGNVLIALGLDINKNLHIAYAHEINNGNLNLISSNTREFLFIYDFDLKKKDESYKKLPWEGK